MFVRFLTTAITVTTLLIACGPRQSARRTPRAGETADGGATDARRDAAGGSTGTGDAAGGGGTGGAGGTGGMAGAGGTGGNGGTGGTGGTTSTDAGRDSSSGVDSSTTKLDTAPLPMDAPPVVQVDTAPPVKLDAAPGVDTTPAACQNLEPTDELIVGFEDGTGKLEAKSGRASDGFTVFSDNETTKPVVTYPVLDAPRCASKRGANVKGGPDTVWGSGAMLPFVRANNVTSLYDGSAYKGVRFFARAVGGSEKLRVNLPIKETWASGGVCGTRCNRHFGKEVTFTTSWQRFTILWSELTQSSGIPGDTLPAFKPAEMVSFELFVPKNSGYELQVDDIAFVK